MDEKTESTWLETPDPQLFINNVAKFSDLMMMYRCVIREVQTKLEILNDEFQYVHKYNPIEHIKSRVKTAESIAKKLKRHGKK